jgi:excinuclease ABC subunit B
MEFVCMLLTVCPEISRKPWTNLHRDSGRKQAPDSFRVTGSGKTFSMASIIARVQKPTLVLAHNKTLAGSCIANSKNFSGKTPSIFCKLLRLLSAEAYVPANDLYIEKDASINEEIEKLRHSATAALFERRDVIVVASVSCIYGMGSPDEYRDMVLSLRQGQEIERNQMLRKLVEIQYDRNDVAFVRGTFRVRGDVVEICPASSSEKAIRVEMFGDEIEHLFEINVLTERFSGNASTFLSFLTRITSLKEKNYCCYGKY